VAVALLGASAQAPHVAATPEPAGEGVVISGTVLAAGGQPLAGATVGLAPVMDDYGGYTFRLGPGRIWAEPVMEVTTGADGRYALAAAAGRRWRVIVGHPDHAPNTRRLEPLAADRELAPVRLAPGRVIEILVLGPGGAPVTGARVMGHSADTVAEEPWPTSWSAASTDASGRARLQVEDMAPWRFEVVADGLPPVVTEHDGDGVAEIRLEQASRLDLALRLASGKPAAEAVVFRPGMGVPLAAADGSGRATLFGRPGTALLVRALTAGGDAVETEVELPLGAGTLERRTLELETPTLIAIDVNSAQGGNPVAGAVAWGSDDLVVHGDAGGRVVLTVPATATSTSLNVVAPGHLPYSEERLPMDVLGGDVFSVTLEPAARFGGRVVNAAGEPLEGVEVEVGPRAGPTVHRFRRPEPQRLAVTGRDGEYSLGPLATGEPLTLVARKPGFSPAGVPVGPLAPFERRGGVEVVLAAGRTVTGTVTDADGRPVAGATVTAARQRPEARLGEPAPAEASATTGPDGGFELRDLGLGRVDLMILAKGLAPARVPGVEIGAAGAGSAAPVELGNLRLESGQLIAGRVVDGEGRPLSEVAVELHRLEQPPAGEHYRPEQAVSDKDGGFAFHDRPPGAYQLRASEEGLLVAWSERLQTPLPSPVELVMRPGATLAGRVVDAAGVAVAGARVYALSGWGGYPGVRTSTDGQGRFELAGLGPVRYSIDVEAEGFQHPERISVLMPEAGSEPVEVVLERGATVVGRVLRTDDRPVDDARIVVRPAAGEEGRSITGFSDASGLFEIGGVPVGPVVVEASRGSLKSMLAIKVGRGRNPVSLVLPKGVAVSGRVLDGDGEPVAAALVLLGVGRSEVGTRSGDDGAFTVTDTAPGKHRLTVRHPDHVEHVSDSGVVVADQPLSGLVVRLRRGARITGTLPGLAPAELAAARVALERLGQHGSFTVAPDHRGRFVVEHVPPGEYQVEAVLDGVVATGAFELAEGVDALEIELRSTSGVDLRGRVVQGGAGVGHVRVRVRTDDGRAVAADTTADGSFVLPRLPEGPLELTAQDLAGNSHRRQIELRTGEPVVVELPSASVSGRVVDAETGEPIPQPIVYLETLEPRRDSSFGGGWERRVHRRATGDSRGAYLFPSVESGRYRVRAEGGDRGMTMRRIEVDRQPLGDVDLALTRSRGLGLRVSRDGGAVPPSIIYVLFDPAGLLEDIDAEELDAEGRLQVDTVPAGSWQLWVRSGDSAWEELSVEVPAEEVSVRLVEGAMMIATVPRLGEELEGLTITLRDAGGRAPYVVQPAISHGSLPSQMGNVEPRLHAFNLWPGEWTLEATHLDGRTWRATFTARPGETAEVELLVTAPRWSRCWTAPSGSDCLRW